MRILYHHRTLADGAEGIHIAEMVEALRSLGHDVRVKGYPPAPERQQPPGLAHEIRHRVPHAAVEAGALLYNAWEYLQACREIARFQPDLIYTRHARYHLATVAAARRRRVPTVLEVNAAYSLKPYLDFEPLRFRWAAEAMERRAFEWASLVVVVSTPLGRQVKALARREALVIPNGANPASFDARRVDSARVRARYGLGPALVVGWTGMLRRWHGLDLLMSALTALPDARLLIVGEGPERPAIERRAAESGILDRLVMTGRVKHSEMPDYLAAMDVAVMSGDRTGVASPMKLLEYMAMSRAVVAPRLDNVVDVIQDEQDGLLFEPGQLPSLTETLVRLAGDVDLRRRLGERARKKIENTLNWQSNAARILASAPSIIATDHVRRSPGR
ncbi:MAG: glycosyltransferase family 4 protein [Acidobacteriota bacterium]